MILLPSPTDIERLGDEIARLAAHLHAATYELLVLIRTFDEQGGWTGGFRSCAHWLSWRIGIGPGPAREKVRVARALAHLPRVSEAMARGELSYSKVRAITRVAGAHNEAELLEVARHATAAHIEDLVRALRRVERLESAEAEEERHRSRFLRLHLDEDGSYVLRARLDPEVGAVLEKALTWAREALYPKGSAAPSSATASGTDPCEAAPETPTLEQRRADALGLVAERALAATKEDGTGRADRFQVVVHVEADSLESTAQPRPAANAPLPDSAVLAEAPSPDVSAEPSDRRVGNATFPRKRETAEGSAGETSAPPPRTSETFAPDTARRLACDASLVVMTHDATGQLLDVGRKKRTVSPALRRALDHRDGRCRFPGCTCRYTDAHHITHWADGGETKLDNLILLCRRHHRMVHQEGYRVVATNWVTGRRTREPGNATSGPGNATSGPGLAAAGRAPVGPVRFFRPDGQPIPEVPIPPRIGANAVQTMKQRHRARGITPDEWTATPKWHGEAMDFGLAVDMVRSLERPPED